MARKKRRPGSKTMPFYGVNAVTGVGTVTPSIGGGGLLFEKSDFGTYLGTFRVQTGVIGSTGRRLQNGQDYAQPIAHDPADNGLFIGCDATAWIAKIAIPALGTQTLSDPFNSSIPIAGMLHDPIDFVEGAIADDGYTSDGSGRDNGGLLVVNNRLLMNIYSVYDGSGLMSKATWNRSTNLSTAGHLGPALINGGRQAGYTSGCMCRIPASWQGALDGEIANCQTGISIISRTSAGPGSFFSWFLSDYAADTPANGLMYWDNISHNFRDELGTEWSFDTGGTRGYVSPSDMWDEGDGVFWNGSHIMRGGGMFIHKNCLIVLCGMGRGFYNYGIGEGTTNPPNPPVVEQNGWTVTNASTSSGTNGPGTRITVPNLNLNSASLDGKTIWIEGETSPVQNANSNNCVRAGCAALADSRKGNSGTPTAYVEVLASEQFTNGLTGKTIHIGEAKTYDPHRGEGEQGNHAYPYFHGAFRIPLSQLAQVKAGTRQPWEVVPDRLWNLGNIMPAFRSEFIPHFLGATKDEANNILYLCYWHGGIEDTYPAISAYQLAS